MIGSRPWSNCYKAASGNLISQDKRYLAGGQRACQWHKPVQRWQDIDPLVNPSQQPGPTEIGGRVFWLEWQNGPDHSLLLAFCDPRSP